MEQRQLRVSGNQLFYGEAEFRRQGCNQTVPAHYAPILYSALSPDGQWAVSCDQATLYVWRIVAFAQDHSGYFKVEEPMGVAIGNHVSGHGNPLILFDEMYILFLLRHYWGGSFVHEVQQMERGLLRSARAMQEEGVTRWIFSDKKGNEIMAYRSEDLIKWELEV